MRSDRVVLAWLAASAVGGVLVALEMVAAIAAPWLLRGGWAQAPRVGVSGLEAWLLVTAAVWAGAVFGIGLAVVGGPVWLVLHARGLRERWIATLAGAVLSLLAGVVILGVGDQADWENLQLAAFLILPGAAAGWILHRVAYGARSPR